MDLSILHKIDWYSLYLVYKLNNWRWRWQRSPYHVPTSLDLYECALELIRSLDRQHPISQMGTGRITVYRLDDVVRVWIGSDQLRAGCRYGFWAHQAAAELARLQTSKGVVYGCTS